MTDETTKLPVVGRADRRRDPLDGPVAYAVQVVARYVVAIAFVSYGLTKIVGTQLTGEPSLYDTPMSALSGFDLTWSYYGFADVWRYLIAAGELTAAALLLFPRTARPGYLLSLLLLSQIVPMDIIYGIDGGTEAAIVLMVLSLLLLAYDLRAVRAFLRTPWTRSVPAVARRFRWVGTVVVVLAVAGLGALYTVAGQLYSRSELSGTWQFRTADGPSRFYVDRGKRCALHFPARVNVRPHDVECTIDESADRLVLLPSPDPDRSFPFEGGYAVGAGGQTLLLVPDGGGAPFELDRAPERFDEVRTQEFADRAENAVG